MVPAELERQRFSSVTKGRQPGTLGFLAQFCTNLPCGLFIYSFILRLHMCVDAHMHVCIEARG